MGKKAKVGKLRRDKFYHLAKESGYRSRAAFKLLQLNREHHFLENARVLIDLCAAPGGWLQVAEKNMPVSSLIIGVDLAPIKAIPHTITYQEDITSEKCRQLLKKDLGTFKADVVLHDGAPNVGKSWIHDAYQQNVLTLNALKLATEFLRKGGTFVTKMFRSKDYYSLLWVFQQMFKRVDSTKPQASRNESAEIFVVCHGYLAPDKIDPKFLDYKHVFTEVENDTVETQNKAKLRLKHPEKFVRSREGYPEGDYTLYHKLDASKFIQSETFLDLLANANEIVIDDERILQHPHTTAEVKECVKDIKVLGRREITSILAWRRHLAASLYKSSIPRAEAALTPAAETEQAKEKDEASNDEQEDLDADIEEQLLKLNEQQRKEAKRKRKHVMKEKRKLRDRLALKMVLPGDIHDHETADGGKNDQGLFDLEKIKTKKQLMEISSAIPDLNLDAEKDDDDDDNLGTKRRIPRVSYDKEKNNGDLSSIDIYKQYLDDEEDEDDDDDDESSMPFESDRRAPKLDRHVDDDDESNDENGDFQNGDDDEEENPLDLDILDAPNKAAKAKTVADVWFEQDLFKQALKDDEDDEEFELERKLDALKTKGVPILGKTTNGKVASDDDDDEDEKPAKKKSKRSLKDDEFEEVPIDQPMKRVHLDAEDLALGHVIAQSKKSREQVLDHSYNRFMGYGDTDGLPKWFVEEEKQHCRASLPVTKELVERYKAKMREINERPTKKVAEAKGRKKRREIRKLEKVRKKAEPLLENPDLNDSERNKQIKDLYRKYGVIGQKKVNVKYVVAKKGQRGNVRPAAGAKGPYKVVDKRLKKDKRANKQRSMKSGKGKRRK